MNSQSLYSIGIEIAFPLSNVQNQIVLRNIPARLTVWRHERPERAYFIGFRPGVDSLDSGIVGPGDQFSFTFQTVGTIRITARSTRARSGPEP